MDEVKCYFDIAIGGQDCGRIVFKLFQDKCPKTCENFRCLCTGEKGIGEKSGKPLHYKNTAFHRLVRNFIIQGGDIIDGNGKGGDSIYGGSFPDENLELAHDEPYLLSMANRGPNTNKSQFFITTNEAPHLDGKHVVFGRVVSGLDTIIKIERQEVDSKSRPIKQIVIKDCGQLTNERLLPEPQIHQDKGRKRKLNSSSQSSGDLSSKSPSISSRSRSRSCSSSSPESSSSTSSSCTIERSKRSPRSGRRRPSRCSSHSACSRSGSEASSRSSISRRSNSSRASSVDRRRKRLSTSSSTDSDNSYSSSSSRGRQRKRRRTNRRLVSTRKVEPPKTTVDASKREDVDDTYVNPHYKCTVNLDEIPEVPVNRFLLRVPAKSRLDDRSVTPEQEDEIAPIQVDLSQFEDIPDDQVTSNDGADQLAENAKTDNGTGVVIKSQMKAATQPTISKSGRIMRGRGTFKFRTPSPDSKDDRYGKSFTSKSSRREYGGSSWSESRYRERRRSPPRNSTRHDSRDRDRNSSRRRDR